MFTITINAVGEREQDVKDALITAINVIERVATPGPDFGKKALGYAFHDNDEHSCYSAQITYAPDLQVTER
jgi:hypothetical protein